MVLSWLDELNRVTNISVSHGLTPPVWTSAFHFVVLAVDLLLDFSPLDENGVSSSL